MFIKLYFIVLPLLLIIDMVWINLIAKNFYQEQIGYLMSKNPNFLAAIIFYLFYIAALVFFVIAPAVEKKMWLQALLTGAFFGFICYATYDLTNLAIVKNWSVTMTLVDMFWGTFLSALISVITYFIATKI